MMNGLSKGILFGALMLVTAAWGMDAEAQGRGRGGPGGFDPSEFRDRMLDRLQEVMGATDEEWQVIEPRISAVMEKQQETNRGGGFGALFALTRDDDDRGGRRGRGFGGRLSEEAQALQSVLKKDSPSAEEIQSKLTALRESRKKEQEELKTAQSELRKVLSVKQEAFMVLVGYLD